MCIVVRGCILLDLLCHVSKQTTPLTHTQCGAKQLAVIVLRLEGGLQLRSKGCLDLMKPRPCYRPQ